MTFYFKSNLNFLYLLINHFKIKTMKKYKLAVFAVVVSFVLSCKVNPLTGKNTLNFVSNHDLFPSSFQQYSQFLTENKVVTGTADAKRVESIGVKIKSAAERYLKSLGHPEYLDGYRWEYKLVDDKSVNAWCMPGGKIVVYTGLLPVAKDDAGLATVMGHEVSHALADHGAQRMSAGQLQQLGAVGVAVATSGQSQEKQQMWAQYYGMGSQLGGMLPFSRSHETEADKIGLILMTLAGYNPEKSIEFWGRMSQSNNGQQAPPEFMSTHPSDETRMATLKSYIPEAKQIAAKFGVTTFK
jgi:predicted Zn-dependent protease